MLPRIFQRLRHRLFGGDTSYDAGLENEALFWRKALADEGKRWSPEAFRQRMDPEFAFPPHLQELVAASPAANRDPIQVLDVGAGPLTAVGFHWPGRQVDLSAVDPLADVFDSILDDLQLAPPTRTRKAAGDDLLSVFPADSFDIVVCSNALDHSRDPPSMRASDVCCDAARRVGLPVALPQRGRGGRLCRVASVESG